MKLFVRRTGGRIGLWGGLLAAALAAFAAGWLVPARAPVGCNLNELTTAPDFSPFSPAAPAVAASDAGTPAAPSLPEKWVCLTFDDGPSKTTPEVLAALDAAGVHGTFFVVATGYNEKYLPLLTQAAAAGHQIALHSASHEYSDIYRSSAAYWKDIALLKQRIAPYVDAESIRYLRFPGGSTNTVSHRYGGSDIMKKLKADAESRGFTYVDWNVCAEDSLGGHPSASTIYNNIIREVGDKNTCVVLMHDTNATKNTAAALPDVIRWFKNAGYRFDTVDHLEKKP